MDSIISIDHHPPTARVDPPTFTAEAALRLVRETLAGRESSATELLQDAVAQVQAALGALFYQPGPRTRLETLAHTQVTEDDAQKVMVRYQQTGRHRIMTHNECWYALPLPVSVRELPEAQLILLLGWPRGGDAAIPSFRRVSLTLEQSAEAYATVAETVIAVRRLRQEGISAAAVERLRDEVLTMVGHHVRTPLAAVQGHAWTLLRYYDKLPYAEQREYLETILAASERLGATFDRILQVAQLSTGAVRLSMEPISLLALARSALMDAEAKQRGHARFVLQAPTENDGEELDGLQLDADQRWLRKVFDELLDNAIRFTPEGGTISIELTAVTGTGLTPAVECVIHDAGPGMAPEQVRHLFDHSPQMESSLARAYFGLGLGLSLCKQVISLHGGAIWAESASEHGTAIHFVLPRTHGAELLVNHAYLPEKQEDRHAR